MSKTDTRILIRAFIEEENENRRAEFRSLGSAKGRYTDAQKAYAIETAQGMGVRATARLLNLQRKTVQRWLRDKGVQVKRCPDWVRDWAYNSLKNSFPI